MLTLARDFVQSLGLKTSDAAHLACALYAKADVLFTTDKKFLSATREVEGMRVMNPIDWFKEDQP